jgi:hypothetical protein
VCIVVTTSQIAVARGWAPAEMLRCILGLVALAARPAGALDNGLGLAGPAMGWCVLPVARPSAATCKEGIADRAK